MNLSQAVNCDCGVNGGEADVIIVGGGISGMVAALKIFQMEPSIKTMILESSIILGGQIYKTYCSQDLGAKFFKKNQTQLIELLDILRVPYQPRKLEKDLKNISTFDIGRWSSLWKFEIRRFLKFLNYICKEHKYGYFKITRSNNTSMNKIINNKLLFSKSKNYARLVVRLVCGVDAENVTISEFLAACSSCEGSNNITDLYFENSEDILQFDTNAFIEKLMGLVVDHVLVKPRSHVIEIFFSGEQYLVRDSQCRIFKSKALIMAIPWNCVMRLDISPVLPLDCRIPYLPNRCLMSSFSAKYRTSHWRERGLSGSVVLDEDQTLICYELEPNVLNGIILHSDSSITSITKMQILERLVKYFGKDILKTRGFAVRCFEQSSILNHPQTIPFYNMIWASSCGAILNRGLISGSIESGARAAGEAVKILRPSRRSASESEDNLIRLPFWRKFIASLNLKEGIYFGVVTIVSSVTYNVVRSILNSK